MKHTSEFISRPDISELPDWLPDDARAYLEHVGKGRSMRALARDKCGHASTISRFVQRLESRRDDPLIDAALDALEQRTANHTAKDTAPNPKGFNPMTKSISQNRIAQNGEIEAEAKRILRRLCETSAFLIVASSMEKAAVMRETTKGKPARIAVLDQHIAQAFALKDWIECYRKGKITCYRITTTGKNALKRLLARETEQRGISDGFAEAHSPFQEQHKEWDTRTIRGRAGEPARKMRVNLAESPVTALARRKDQHGQPFLSAEQVLAGECLREDFEMAQMGPRITQNWDRFLTSGRTGGFGGDTGPAAGPQAARARVAAALKALGPGLGDIALRCCCFLEGLETAEKRMGWSARSGKIVLRIALQRLKHHYEDKQGTLSPLIG